MRLILVLAISLLATSCRRQQPAPGVHTDPAMATLVPSGTTLLIGAKIEALEKTPTYRKYFENRSFPQLDEFAKHTGLDPRKDIWDLLVCSNGHDAVVMGRGKFSAGDLEPRLTRDGATRLGYRGYTLFGNEQAAVLFMSGSTALFGPTPALRQVIDERNGARAGIPAPLDALLKTLPADSQFWAVYAGGSFRLPVREDSNLANINRMIQSVEKGTLSADLRNGLALASTATCATQADAKQVHDALRGLIGIGRLSTPDNQPDMLRIYDAIQVTQDQQKVLVSINVPQDLADEFLKTWIKQ